MDALPGLTCSLSEKTKVAQTLRAVFLLFPQVPVGHLLCVKYWSGEAHNELFCPRERMGDHEKQSSSATTQLTKHIGMLLSERFSEGEWAQGEKSWELQ